MRKSPTITLHPGRDKSVRHRHPWLFSGAIARIDGNPDPGEVVKITDAAEAFLASPPKHGAHCIVLDIQLGGMSGLELQRKLKANGSRLPVIVMTAFDDVHVREEATRIGCLGYLDKAADLDVLVSLIRSV